jgi:hypothetical protein
MGGLSCLAVAGQLLFSFQAVQADVVTLTDQVVDGTKDPEETIVKASIESNYSVIIPKRIELSKDKTATYTVSAYGDIAGEESVTVEPDKTVTMYQIDKDSQIGTIEQSITSFRSADYSDNLNNEVKMASTKALIKAENQITGTISATSLTAGTWSGFFNFNINLGQTVKIDAYTISWDEPIANNGNYIGDVDELPSPSRQYMSNKRIVYTDVDGETAYANPYEAGSINIKKGTALIMQMYSGGDEGTTYWLVDDSEEPVDKLFVSNYNIAFSSYIPRSNGTITKKKDNTCDYGEVFSTTEWYLVFTSTGTLDAEVVASSYTLTWTSALSEYGKYIGDDEEIPESGSEDTIADKRIVYIDADGNTAYANPYEAGSIVIKAGTSVTLQMYSGHEYRLSWTNENHNEDTITNYPDNIVANRADITYILVEASFTPGGNGKISFSEDSIEDITYNGCADIDDSSYWDVKYNKTLN